MKDLNQTEKPVFVIGASSSGCVAGCHPVAERQSGWKGGVGGQLRRPPPPPPPPAIPPIQTIASAFSPDRGKTAVPASQRPG